MISLRTISGVKKLVRSDKELLVELRSWYFHDRRGWLRDDCRTRSFDEWLSGLVEHMSRQLCASISDRKPSEIVNALRINAVGDVNALREARLAKRAGFNTDTNCYIEDGVVNANVFVEGADFEKVSRRAKLIKDRFVKMGYSAEVWIDEEENSCQTVNAQIDLAIYLRMARKFVV